MKKISCAILALAILAPAAHAAGLSAALTFSYIGMADSGFREVYGAGGFMPGLRLEAALGGSVSIYAAYGYFTQKGETPLMGHECDSTQHHAAAGAAWRRSLSPKLDGFLHAGLAYVRYSEKAMDEEISGGALGAEAGAGLDFKISSRLFVQPFVSYLYAGDTVDGAKVKLGGFRAGLGLGVRW